MVQCTNKVIMVFGKCKKRKTSSLHPGQFRPSRKGNRILEALTYEIRGTQIDKKCCNTEYRERPSNINLSCFMRRVTLLNIPWQNQSTPNTVLFGTQNLPKVYEMKATQFNI